MWERFMKGEYKLGVSSIKIDKGKIYLLAVFKFSKEYREPDRSLLAEVNIPALLVKSHILAKFTLPQL